MPCGDCGGLLSAGEKNIIPRDGSMKMHSIQIPRSVVSYLNKMVEGIARHTKQISVCQFLTTFFLTNVLGVVVFRLQLSH